PCIGLALLVRPAVLAIAVAFALVGVGRAELPPTDAQAVNRAMAAAGQWVTITGRIADDSHPAAGGAEALVELDHIAGRVTPPLNIGNLLVRWRGPIEAA